MVKIHLRFLGFLTDVLHSNGTSRHYLYEGGLLTSVRDEQNRVLLHNEYRGKWVIRQQFGDGDAIEYNYAVAPNTFYAQTRRSFSDAR